MTTPVELYPLSTQDAKSIPLEIVAPNGMIYQAMATSWSTIVLTDLYNLAVIFSSVALFLDITNTAAGSPTSGTSYSGWIYIPADTAVTVALPTGSIKVRAVAGSGDAYINGIQKWAALGLPRQFNSQVS